MTSSGLRPCGLALLAILCASGCGAIPEGVLACSTQGDCPSGWLCIEGRCYERIPSADAGRVDGGRDDGGRDDGGRDDGGPRDASFDAPPCPGTVETCNATDDDCDGAVDEDFDTSWDPRHCGSCEIVCSSSRHCAQGMCRISGTRPANLTGWSLTAMDVTVPTSTVGRLEITDVVAFETDECASVTYAGLFAGQASMTGGTDAAVSCRSGMTQHYRTTLVDAAHSMTRWNDTGVLMGGKSGPSALLYFVPNVGMANSLPSTFRGSGAETFVTGTATDNAGVAYFGGQSEGRVTLPSELGGGMIGSDLGGINGFAMGTTGPPPGLGPFLMVDDSDTAVAGRQIVHRVAARDGLLALCGAFDTSVRVNATGTVTVPTDDDAFVGLYDLESGTLLWLTAIAGANQQDCQGVGIDGEGNVYAAILFGGQIVQPIVTAIPTGMDTLVAVFSRDEGTWMRATSILGNGEQRLTDLRVDLAGNVYAVGLTQQPITLPGGTTAPSGAEPIAGYLVSLDRELRPRWSYYVGAADTTSDFSVFMLGVDFVDRAGYRAVVVGGYYTGSIVPALPGLSITGANRAGYVIVLEE